MRLRLVIASGLIGAAVWASAPAQAQPLPQPAPSVTPTLAVDSNQPGAIPHWTITVGAEYCGGYRVGDGVYVNPEPPLALPATVPDGSALYAGQPASIDWVNGALRIGPGAGLVQSMICIAGQRPLKVELLPQAGFGLPGDPGDYVVDVWTGARPSPVSLTVSVPSDPADAPEAAE